MEIKININDQVTVILTKYGQEILEHFKRENEEEMKMKFVGLTCDENGKYVAQLWHLMYIFGEYMYNGVDQVFLNNKIYLD